MEILRSALLEKHGFCHGFSLRTGGVSEAPFDSLNLGRGLGDRPESVSENHDRFQDAVGYAGALFEVSQVHGRAIHEVSANDDPLEVRRREGDALMTREAGVAVGIRVADCTPLLIANRATGAVAAVHAGWRGVENEIVIAAIEAMLEAGARASDLCAAIGPHIGKASFEVGEEVAQRLQASAARVGAGEVVDRTFAKPHVDLLTIVGAQLQQFQVEHEVFGGCTFAHPERFFSYRRDGKTGRHLAVIEAR